MRDERVHRLVVVNEQDEPIGVLSATAYVTLIADFRRTATSLDVAVYMVLGEHEARGRAAPANDWFKMLTAPTKERIIFEGAGHRANFDRPADFAVLMSRVVDETYAR